MSDSLLVPALHARAVACGPLPAPVTGPPGVRLVAFIPEGPPGLGQAVELLLTPDNAARLSRALMAAAEAVRHPFQSWEAEELGINRPPPLPGLTEE